MLDFEGDPAEGSLSVIEHPPATQAPPGGAHEWFERGSSLERNDIEGAIDAYERAVVAEPTFVDAHINLGRLLHESRRYASAERVYREGIRLCGRDADRDRLRGHATQQRERFELRGAARRRRWQRQARRGLHSHCGRLIIIATQAR